MPRRLCGRTATRTAGFARFASKTATSRSSPARAIWRGMCAYCTTPNCVNVTHRGTFFSFGTRSKSLKSCVSGATMRRQSRVRHASCVSSFVSTAFTNITHVRLYSIFFCKIGELQHHMLEAIHMRRPSKCIHRGSNSRKVEHDLYALTRFEHHVGFAEGFGVLAIASPTKPREKRSTSNSQCHYSNRATMLGW